MMTLHTLLSGVVVHGLPESPVAVSQLAIDSREVKPGALFVAITGFKSDGHRHAAQAVKNGAVAVLAEKEIGGLSVPVLRVENTRLALAHVAAVFYGHPANSLSLVGVTGTNGKTTVTTLLEAILLSASRDTGLIGTLGYRWSQRSYQGVRTTPDALDLHRLFREMADDQVETVVMEISSHAMKLHRAAGLLFDAVVFTNFTRDHMDFHPTEADYLESKVSLFRQLQPQGVAVINGDDAQAGAFVQATGERSLTFGFISGNDAVVTGYEYTARGSRFRFRFREQEYAFSLPLWGKFNVVNGMAAAVTALGMHVSAENIQRGFNRVQRVPGRMDGFTAAQGYRVVVDYAHTPDALENVIRAVREMTTGRVIVLFGCGGDRDAGKRPLMARIAENSADLCVVTSDNPRSESPSSIIDAIVSGFVKPAAVQVIEDRQQAIEWALGQASADDCVLIAGKGHETYQEIRGVRHHFDDLEIARAWTEAQS